MCKALKETKSNEEPLAGAKPYIPSSAGVADLLGIRNAMIICFPGSNLLLKIS